MGSKNKVDDDMEVPGEGNAFKAIDIAESRIAVKQAFLHQALTWPGVAGAERTISEAKIKGVKLFWAPQGLILEAKGQTCIVPHANVANAILL